MKIEMDKEIIVHEKHIKKNHDHCKEHEDFLDILEKEIKSSNIEESDTTSIFAEKRTNKNKTDIFDTLIDI